MKLKDAIYGDIKIDNKIICDLIATRPFQRLKSINQYGGVNFVYKEAYQTTRYEHSIGVWYATFKLGADLETQVAALLHDVGHFAFSHLVDMAKADAAESEHEFSRTDLEGWDEVERILSKNALELKEVDEYKLIKNSLPDIGTDRFDYAIRDLEAVAPRRDQFGAIAIKDIELLDGEIVFKTLEVAREYAERGNKAMRHLIYDPKIAVVYQSVIEILRDGLTDGWISRQDLLSTDEHVFDLFRQKRDEYPEKYFRVFSDRYNVAIVGEEEMHDFRFVKLKSRYFDPRVKVGIQEVKRVSELNAEFRASLEKYIEIFQEAKRGVNLRLIF